MKNLMLLTTFLLGITAFAHPNREELTCQVTEPFHTYTFSFNTLTRTGMDIYPGVEVISRNVELVSADPNEDGMPGSEYKLVDTKTGAVYVEMTLDNKGTDGMSDRTFPFSAKIGSWYGGCESTSAPAIHAINAISNLKAN